MSKLEQAIRAALPSFTDTEIVAPAAQAEDTFLLGNLTYRWYYAVGMAKAPRWILETGVKYGYSAIAMCKGARQSGQEPVFVGIDAEADGITCNPIAKAALDSLGIQHRIIRANTRDVDTVNASIEESFDIVHIDADHSPEGIAQELRIAEKFVSSTGLILVDDVDVAHVADPAAEFAASRGISILHLPTQHGVFVIDMNEANKS